MVGCENVTLRIETRRRGSKTLLHLIGRIRGEHVPTLERLLTESGADASLDLQEVTLVDADVIKFLAVCANRGIPILHSGAYITDWIEQEQQRHS